MTAINQQMTREQLADLSTLAAQLLCKAEANDDRDTAVMAYAVQRACSELEESRREFTAANATIHNLELKVEQAMSERDVVNADNAYLRGQVIYWARECDRITYTHTNKITDAHQLEAERELANTNPAVGAYLAEVLAAEAKSIYESILDNPAVTDMESLVDWLEQHASDAVSFAAQLRQGAEQ
ncbi:TPA: hypothetical protein PFE16_004321 [Kluyvera georgiana]|uniref:hypothetical protein n=1 Tax=Kluyvera ascorbata TaxID=51288 RepID=UPI002DBB65D6|nr:hypothetical protein [Kluyvera ascorbata]MEB6387770.1 hypothetical protein [Kluyvera ascorbata]HDG1692792.1 hypothetical protein [Kluyvera georgiana]